MRKFGLYDGDGMGGELIIFESNAPTTELQQLENISQDNAPIWSVVLTEKGYVCEYIDSCTNITPYTTSEEWQKENFPEVTEFYYID